MITGRPCWKLPLILSSHDYRKNFLVYPNSFSNGYGDGHGYENQLICLDDHTKREEQDQWQLQQASYNGEAELPVFLITRGKL
ncbi:hypothetical protein NC651_024382 [Populus alba x Populus x berolinensis]|nr:hypothetical protein NC651_024382 [Populus alba x Populus x berolinensis]